MSNEDENCEWEWDRKCVWEWDRKCVWEWDREGWIVFVTVEKRGRDGDKDAKKATKIVHHREYADSIKVCR